MIKKLLRKRGVPVLVCLASDVTCPLPCTFQVKHGQVGMHKVATIELEYSTRIRGHDDDQIFTFLYHADNLALGKTCLKHPTALCPKLQSPTIAQGGEPVWDTLTLSLHQPCPIVCPASSACISSESGYETSFLHLVGLAKATEVLVSIDVKWFNPEQRRLFDIVIRRLGEFKGVEFEGRNAQGRKQADWSIFSPIEDHETVFDPPPYAKAATKRARKSSSSPQQSPPSKRVLSLASEFVGSPTEKATTAPIPSPNGPFSPAVGIEEMFNQLLNQALPGKVSALLEQMFVNGPAKARPSLSPSPTSSSPSLHSKPKPLSTLRARMDEICASAVDRAHYLRDTADDEFFERIEDHKIDVQILRDDTVTEVQREIDDNLGGLRQSVADIVEEAREHIDDELDRMRRRAAEVVKQAMEDIDNHAWQARNTSTEHKWVDRRGETKEEDTSGTRTGKRRAASLPL